MANYGAITRQRAASVRKTGKTPQTQPIREDQTKNHAGGYGWDISDRKLLDRFLILGAEGGTYYVTENKLVGDNAAATKRCIAQDGAATVARIVEISEAGRAPKNDAALFALALAATAEDEATRQSAFAALPRVARTGTHLFQFASYVETQRGWGRGLRRAVSNWYNGKPADDVAYQAVKYQSRKVGEKETWTHRDLLRLAHAKPETAAHASLYGWITGNEYDRAAVPSIVTAYEAMKAATTEGEVIDLIQRHRFTWEMVPGQWLGSKAVWLTLLPNLPMGALVRNLGRMTASGALTGMNAKSVVDRLLDANQIAKARMHPIAFLSAGKTYKQGHGDKSDLRWSPVPQIVDALNDAFYLAFKTVEPTGLRYMLGIDVSSSMLGGNISGMPSLSPAEGAAVMALATARVESNYVIRGFAGDLVELPITPRMQLDDVLRMTRQMAFGSTDCALPMQFALRNKLPVDAFVIYTDSETWYGKQHPTQALAEYRQKMGINAKLIVVALTASARTIADPKDPGMLDLVGFDAASPALIAEFSKAE